ncbi:Nitric oxide reductase subunit C [Rhodovastum atsumiense]|uniref:Cytochrome c n=1 Tax=Rhodovastum atsumiense TaxID=504468 RepID=A0A5M6ITS6_9PROT|nr:cytochrome c [Rhodovastum atsumiense]KAA5611329.1 cytochrome c [Rhodovastum atsumiense]CAH2601806.1 Nitric oxide reductase subunit C [Rhodovastum atsumiense]
MPERLTRAATRNIFYGGSAFFLVVFLALTLQTHFYMTAHSAPATQISEGVARGKRVWERNACIDCHTLLGEGAYFAPELGNVWKRWGGDADPEVARAALAAWMASQPSGVPGRRQMPQFHLTEQEVRDLADFLEFVSKIDTQGWPPNTAG